MMKFVIFTTIIVVGILLGVKMPTPRNVVFKPVPLLIAGLLMVLVIVLMPSMGIVNTGERGVVLRLGASTGRILGEGPYLVTPLVERVEIMSVQVEAYEAQSDAASRDMQQVRASVTLNYSLDPKRVGEIYTNLRRDYVGRVIIPAIQEAVKAATAQFDAESLVGKRELVKEQIEAQLQERLTSYGISVRDVSITNFDFSTSFNEAIEAKAAAVQQAAKAARDLDRVKMEAQQKIEVAKAEAEALRVQRMNVTPELLRLRQIEVQKAAIDKWDGHMPQVVTGNNMPFIMNLGEMGK